jgi:D-alanyl-lipoteichoic acid acyltransferase DltB (MBOAT superfamily)
MLTPLFYVLVAGCFVLMQLHPTGKRCAWFGLLNLIVLAILFDYRVVLVLGFLSTGLWAALLIQCRLQARARHVGSAVVLASLYGSALTVFLFHKSFLDAYGFLRRLHASLEPVHFAPFVARLLVSMAFSYMFLRIIDAIRSASSGERLLDPLSLSGYLLPFFMVASGPLNTYADHAAMDDEVYMPPRFSSFVEAVELVVSGLFMKIVLAEGFRLLLIGNAPFWPAGSFIQTAEALLYVFLEFYGYSLAALGIGKLLGVPTPVNFRQPYLSLSVTDFFTRWHMSLGNFVRTNVFIPLQVTMLRRLGRKYAYRTNLVALIVSFCFVGLWHRFTFSFLLWGAMMGLIMTAEKLLRDRWGIAMQTRHTWLAAVNRFIGPAYVFFVIVGSLTVVMSQLMGSVQ